LYCATGTCPLVYYVNLVYSSVVKPIRGMLVAGLVVLAVLGTGSYGAFFSGQAGDSATSGRASEVGAAILQNLVSGSPTDARPSVLTESYGSPGNELATVPGSDAAKPALSSLQLAVVAGLGKADAGGSNLPVGTTEKGNVDAPAAPSQPQEQGSAAAIVKNKAWDNIDFGPRKLCNNVWGVPDGETLTSDIYLNNNSSFGWSWTRLDPKTRPGNEFVLPMYPSVRIGGSPWDASNSTYFPMKADDSGSLVLEVSYAYTTTPTGTYNLAYDLFLSDTDQPSSTPKPNAEVMIWLHGSLGQPADAFKGDFTDGINIYSLYSFVMANGRLYYAFVLKEPAQFQANVTVNAGRLLGALNLDPNWYIHGVELGNEVVDGSGRIEISRLTATVNGRQI